MTPRFYGGKTSFARFKENLSFKRISCVCYVLDCLSRPTLWDSMDCSLPGSSVHGILQIRIVEWVAMHSSRGSS